MLWQGAPLQLLTAAEQGKVELYTCQELISELSRVLSRPKFVGKLAAIGSSPKILMQLYRSATTSVHLPAVVPRISRDPNDDIVLACALTAAADVIVSGDGDLLV